MNELLNVQYLHFTYFHLNNLLGDQADVYNVLLLLYLIHITVYIITADTIHIRFIIKMIDFHQNNVFSTAVYIYLYF